MDGVAPLSQPTDLDVDAPVSYDLKNIAKDVVLIRDHKRDRQKKQPSLDRLNKNWLFHTVSFQQKIFSN